MIFFTRSTSTSESEVLRLLLPVMHSSNFGSVKMMDDSELRTFKRDYYFSKGRKYNLDVQVPHLARLADIYHKRYLKSPSPDWTDCLKVSKLR